jgi:photosystem II stability/assembly factor-like uncharacterized protein
MNKLLLTIILFVLLISDSNSQWILQYTPAQSQSSYVLNFFDDNTGYYSGVLYNSSTYNIYKTTNGGLNFTAQNSGLTAQRFMAISMRHPDTVFISGNYGKILRTYNGGNNWNLIYSDTLIQFWGLFFVNSNTGFAAGSSGRIMKTTNKGDNWVIQTAPTSTALDGIYFINENTGYIGGANVFLKTTDGGQTWVNKVGLFISPFETAQSVYFSDANTGYYCTNTANCRIVKTTDGGDTWTLIHTLDNIGAGWDMSFTNANTGYICTGAGKVLKTTNAGLNWGVQNTPLTENLYAMDFPSVNTGYISTWSGKVLKTTNGGLTFVGRANNEIPSGFELKQNYPNPFNPATTIEFSLPISTFTELKIFDINGREVAKLLSENLPQGNYSVPFNAEKLSSGIYLCRLNAKNLTLVRKMNLVK